MSIREVKYPSREIENYQLPDVDYSNTNIGKLEDICFESFSEEGALQGFPLIDKKIYTILAYKQENRSYSRGCLMETFPSGFVYVFGYDKNLLINSIAEKTDLASIDKYEGDYHFDILINGIRVAGSPYLKFIDFVGSVEYTELNEEGEDILNKIKELRVQKLQEYQENKKKEEELEEEQERIRSIKDKEERDKKEYERLKEKYKKS